jgi:hypothetical protein
VPRLRPRLSYANVVSTLALFLALGGASYAALELPARSVGRAQLRDEAVTSRVLSRPVRTKLQRVAERGPQGDRGPAGPPGERAPLVPLTGEMIADDTLRGDNIVESSLGIVPLAHTATQLAGVPTDEIVQGAGRLHSYMNWPAFEAPSGRGLVGLLENHISLDAYCREDDPYFQDGVQLVLANNADEASVWSDDGVAPPRYFELARFESDYGEVVTDATRRIVYQGRAGLGAFFLSVVVSHENGICRAGVVGFETR